MVRFLIIRFSSIGDIVLTTPVIRCLKEQVDQSEVYFLTKKQYQPVLRNNPYLTKVFYLDNNMGLLLGELKKQQFDYIIDLHKNLRSFRIKTGLRKCDFSFNKLNWQKWVMVNFKRNYLPDIHIVDRYLKILDLFDVTNDNKGLEYFLKEEEIESVANYTKILGKYIVFVVGARHKTKQVSIQIVRDIFKDINLPVILLGGKEDIPVADDLKHILVNAINLTGKLDLNHSAAIVKSASVVVTPDTGLMHIACAFNRPVISIWGNTIPEFGMYPYLPGPYSMQFEVKDLPCRPCSKIGFGSCPKKHFKCMMDQDVKAINRQILFILNQT